MIQKEELVDYDVLTGRMRSTPRQIFLETTSRCNLACVHCSKDYGSEEGHPELDLAFATVEKLRPWLREAEAVNLNIVGEPLFARRFPEILDLCAASARRVCFNTNGLLLDPGMCNRLVSRGVFSVAVSIDGLATNHALRGISYELLRERLLELHRAKQRAGARRPEIAIAYTLLRRNVHELPDLLEDLLPTGAVQAVHVQPLIVFYEGLRGENVYDRDDVDRTFAECHAIARRHGVFLALFRSAFLEDESNGRHPQEIPLGQRSERFGCIDPFFEIKIRSNGEVMSCSNGRHGGLDVNQLSLDEVWNHPWYRALRQDLYAKRFQGECARCPYVRGSRANQEAHLRPGVHHSHEWRLGEG